MDDTLKADVRRRLRKIEGQIAGVGRMIEEDRYCIDVLVQLASVQSALGRVGGKVFEAHIQTCVREAIESGDPERAQRKVDEAVAILQRYSGLLCRALS
jgi:CsoR family transcriptional regulator, copper-sensing transcriptional repressor